MNVLPNLNLGVGVSQATASGDNFTEVSGLTDVQIGLGYSVAISDMQRLVVNLMANIPTGLTQMAPNVYDTAFQLGLSQLGYRVPFFGQGQIIAPGISFIAPITSQLVASAGISYRIRGEFEPLEDLVDIYDWGNEVLLTAGLNAQISQSWGATLDLLFTVPTPDKIGGVEVYAPGNRFLVHLMIEKELERQDLAIGFRYRSVATNQVSFGGGFFPEVARAFPGLTSVFASFRHRFSSQFLGTAIVDLTNFEADFAFPDAQVINVSVMPEYMVSPSFSIPVVLRYTLGDVEGFEAGLGINAVF